MQNNNIENTERKFKRVMIIAGEVFEDRAMMHGI